MYTKNHQTPRKMIKNVENIQIIGKKIKIINNALFHGKEKRNVRWFLDSIEKGGYYAKTSCTMELCP